MAASLGRNSCTGSRPGKRRAGPALSSTLEFLLIAGFASLGLGWGYSSAFLMVPTFTYVSGLKSICHKCGKLSTWNPGRFYEGAFHILHAHLYSFLKTKPSQKKKKK